MINSFLFDLDDTIISREKAFDGVLKSLIVKWFDSYSPKEKNNLFTYFFVYYFTFIYQCLWKKNPKFSWQMGGS